MKNETAIFPILGSLQAARLCFYCQPFFPQLRRRHVVVYTMLGSARLHRCK